MKVDAAPVNRLTAHVGMFERGVPAQRWGVSTLLMFGLLVAGAGGWELAMRSLGLRTVDIDDGKAQWAVERRKVNNGPRDQVVILGDSRILFDTHLDTFAAASGIRPIQLALQGTNARPFLKDLADDEHFAGLVVLGFAEGTFISDAPGQGGGAAALPYLRNESPSQRAGFTLGRWLSGRLAFLDDGYSLTRLIARTPVPNRHNVAWRPVVSLPKLSESFAHRQTTMWPRLEADASYRQSVRSSWQWALSVPPGVKLGPPPEALLASVIASTRSDVDRIRARGGEVVLVHPPSDGPFRQLEQVVAPRALVWDRLARETSTFDVHFADYPAMQGLTLPEWSHLTGEDAKTFTRAYVSVLCNEVSWLRQHGAHCAAAQAVVKVNHNNRRGYEEEYTNRTDISRPRAGRDGLVGNSDGSAAGGHAAALGR